MILNIIEDLIPNLAIFVSTSFLIYLFMRNERNFKNFYDIKPSGTVLDRMFFGIIDGLIGTIIMLYGITVGFDVLIDLRHFSIMMSALYGGIPAALVTGSIIAGGRFIFFEGSSYSSLLGSINAINMALVSGIIGTFVNSRQKWIYMNIYCLISISMVAFLLLNGEWFKAFLPLLLTSCICAFCIYFFHDYLTRTLYLQRKIKENDDKFRAITENIWDIVSIIDTEGKTTYVSPSIRIYGIEPEEYEGIFSSGFIHPDDRLKVEGLFKKSIVDKISFRVEFRWRVHDNSWIDWDISGTPIIENDTVTSVVVVCRDITDRKKIEQSLLYLSNNDGLTGVANRRFFDQKLEKEWSLSKKNNTFLSLIMFDIDHFKLYNDTYGHQAGDTCLKIVAAYVKEIIKAPHLVARYGGEEFAVILIEKNDADAIRIAERIRVVVESLRISHQASKKDKIVTVSLGVATQGHMYFNTKEELIETADQALYLAKKNGRNRVGSFV